MDQPHPALQTLEAQRQAWNAGDLQGYLDGCAPDVVYLSARGPVYGREALRARMIAAYPDRAAMGTLSLEVLHLDAKGDVRVVLRWSIARSGASDIGGHAFVILDRTEGSWLVTWDATLG